MKKNRITVVFSSHLGKEINNTFRQHIDNTIGVEHFIICYENPNEFSLSELYNEAIEHHSSDDNILAFCHPDIIFKTNNWGKLLLNQFHNHDYGILGVAGTTHLTETGRWWDKNECMIGIVEHTNGINTWENRYSESFYGVRPTVLVDGVFIAIDPEKIIHGFDTNYGKFHFYDLGFCIPNYLDGVNIGVITNIRILHKSIGITNEDWETNRIKFAENYKDELPIIYQE